MAGWGRDPPEGPSATPCPDPDGGPPLRLPAEPPDAGLHGQPHGGGADGRAAQDDARRSVGTVGAEGAEGDGAQLGGRRGVLVGGAQPRSAAATTQCWRMDVSLGCYPDRHYFRWRRVPAASWHPGVPSNRDKSGYPILVTSTTCTPAGTRILCDPLSLACNATNQK